MVAIHTWGQDDAAALSTVEHPASRLTLMSPIAAIERFDCYAEMAFSTMREVAAGTPSDAAEARALHGVLDMSAQQPLDELGLLQRVSNG